MGGGLVITKGINETQPRKGGVMQDLFKSHILSQGEHYGRFYTTCPACSEARSNGTSRKKKVLGINYEDDQAVYFCNHCGQTGHVWLNSTGNSDEKAGFNGTNGAGNSDAKLPQYPGLGQPELDYLLARGIESSDSLDLFASERTFSNGDDLLTVRAIGFPYHLDRNVKWIADNPLGGKLVQWERKGGGAGLYRRESIDFTDQCLVICEGEVDCESARSIGFNSISVPNGAPQGSQIERIFKSITDKISAFQRVVIAMDDDEAGQKSLEALVDLVGRKRAHTIAYPAGCSDVNDVLVKFGQDGLRAALTNTRPCLSGIVSPKSFLAGVNDLRANGFGEGGRTGLEPLDELIRWHPGMLGICSGIPSSGKSELLDELMVRLADNDDWKWAVFSPENTGEFHLSKLAAKRLRKPVIGDNTVLATEEQFNEACDWVDERFLFLSSDGGTTIRSLLDRAEACKHKLRADRFGLIIDPWNYVTGGSAETSETERVNQLLSQIKTWAIRPEINALVIVVAHPTKQPQDANHTTLIGGYSLSGSAHWYNRADIGWSVAANREEQLTNVNVWKVRFQFHGHPGECVLGFDPLTGTYSSPYGNASELDTINWEHLEGREHLENEPDEQVVRATPEIEATPEETLVLDLFPENVQATSAVN
jgi:twinkle protein